MDLKNNTYDQYAEQYVRGPFPESAYSIIEPEGHDFFYHLVSHLLEYVRDVRSLTILDAGCGEGFLSRILAGSGAIVTGIDISPRLIEVARSKDTKNLIDFRVADLSQPLPEFQDHFDLVVSNLVLNDVCDYQGFISTLGKVTRAGGRVVLSMNSPYSAVRREKTENYFDSGTSVLYTGLSAVGIKVYFFHRTMEEYITAFRDCGFLLKSLSDVRPPENALQSGDPRAQKHYHFPVFMVLEFVKVE